MFTGIVEALGAVVALGPDTGGDSFVLTLELPFAHELVAGESVAVNGCCLTVTSTGGGRASFNLLAETLRATNLGALQPRDSVNLERAVRAGDRLSGHYVQGHIDTTAPVVAYEPAGADHRLEVALPDVFARYVAYKGSVAVNGTSLTVATIDDDARTFTAWIIPHTHSATNLHALTPGSPVNLEFDILAKYLERLAGRPGR